MQLLQWEPKLSVGVTEIDQQHQQLLSIVNRFVTLLEESRARDQLQATLHELMNYADYHFGTEEKYFDAFNYEDAIPHKTQHQAFRDKIHAFTQNETSFDTPYELIDFLEDWWINHIMTADQLYSTCFRSHGLT